MIIFRYTLLGFSALAAVVLLIFWIVSGRTTDVVLFVVLAFLIANAFYIFISRPTVKTSDILARASTGLALVSLELQHQAQEAQLREVEAERCRLSDEEKNQFKLQVAKDILQSIPLKLELYKKKPIELPKITNQIQPNTDALPLPPSNSIAAENVRPLNGHDAETKPTQPVVEASPHDRSLP